jgi:hypothetical protein
MFFNHNENRNHKLLFYIHNIYVQKVVKIKKQAYFSKNTALASGLPTELSTAFVGK